MLVAEQRDWGCVVSPRRQIPVQYLKLV